MRLNNSGEIWEKICKAVFKSFSGRYPGRILFLLSVWWLKPFDPLSGRILRWFNTKLPGKMSCRMHAIISGQISWGSTGKKKNGWRNYKRLCCINFWRNIYGIAKNISGRILEGVLDAISWCNFQQCLNKFPEVIFKPQAQFFGCLAGKNPFFKLSFVMGGVKNVSAGH